MFCKLIEIENNKIQVKIKKHQFFNNYNNINKEKPKLVFSEKANKLERIALKRINIKRK